MAIGPTPSFQKVYRIHPGMGVARIGNSRASDEEGYFIGPEVPDIDFMPPGGKYRDAQNDIRRQGTRFRIYEYTYVVSGPPTPLLPHPDESQFVREITADDGTIQWHVHLANRKSHNGAGKPIHNDPSEQTVSGLNQTADVIGDIFGERVQLGTLKTDDKGRLIVLGGFGKSASPENLPITGLYSRGWYDDVSDGSVRATLNLKGTDTRQSVEPAWVLVGVPRFAEPVSAIVTMYDLAYDVATRLPAPNTLVPPTEVSFARDIYPVLFRAVMMRWVISTARMGHGSGAGGDFLESAQFDLLRSNDPTPGSPARLAREHVTSRLRPIGNMPDLAGGLQLTDTKLACFKQWAAGNFVADWAGPPVVQPFAALKPLQQTRSLDMTGLWTAVGGAFAPGIEASSVMAQPATYQQPFRINQTLPPGTLTEGLSIPWQADYRACGLSWWPSGRPDEVTGDGSSFYEWIPRTMTLDQLIQDWWKLGFLHKKEVAGANVYVEEERLLP
jgi:hypothetical protein